MSHAQVLPQPPHPARGGRAMGTSLTLAALLALPAVPAEPWPHPIPARVQDGPNPDLFVMTLGPVGTPLAQGIYDPLRDQVALLDGSVLPHYYRDRLGLNHFKPMDKSVFPEPPSGFCTWYYYYQDLDEGEVRRSTDWLARNLKDYGARIVQVDDAWQKEKEDGGHGSRDWSGVDAHFPGGMAALAAHIKARGFVPGLWVAPHGQSNPEVVRANPGVFLQKPDGTSPSDTWEGKWLVDPSAPAAPDYLRRLFGTFTGWGFDYFKIDGQPVVLDEYRRTRVFMHEPGEAGALYRRTVGAIRDAIGPRRYLLGCWGLPVEGMGLMDGCRTGGDVVRGWDGFLTALEPTLRSYYQHNIAWYTDPDVMLVRSPLTLDQARAWATLQGLTGQALFVSDRLMDLSRDRVDILRKVFPAADIRPLDLFPSTRAKRIWDLKIHHLGRAYDVAGVFNYGTLQALQVALSWKDLGLPAQAPLHVFDFWNQEYLGAWEAGFAVDLPPTSCRVLALVPCDGAIQLVSTSRHITQGWVDVQALRTEGNTVSGASRVIRDDPYDLHFAYPRGRNFQVASATARGASGPLPVSVTCHQGWATVRIRSSRTQRVAWKVTFRPAPAYAYPTRPPEGLQVEPAGLDGAILRWRDAYYLNAGYQVYLDGQLLGHAGGPAFPLTRLDPRRPHTAQVRSAWEDGGASPGKAELTFTVAGLLPGRLDLGTLEPLRSTGIRSAAAAFTVAGAHRRGLPAHAEAELEYDLKALYTTFSGEAAFDDSDRGRTKVTFTVLGDGRELWTSGALTGAGGPRAFRIPIAGVRRLVLRTTAPGAAPEDDDWANAPHAGWLEPVLEGPAR
ncbi:NPCBM/NEW2 domain-containing protein [Mesoterricola silvestris]|uniref:Glycosyl hydrolase family 98 putative carbohydrate-binding module domain-containing protein n=1 Tax=Mesoterricola silvestris TaxID=2927979 RepID=A0AA48GZF9_9BACT|nr:NPCBM/NEW2 domain-containing protein [Mesoterricola silvestris]BDU73198.1 hypothetical protein METEAL_23720 [Mesoterricola silvestris]